MAPGNDNKMNDNDAAPAAGAITPYLSQKLQRAPQGLPDRLARAYARDQSEAMMMAAQVRIIALIPVIAWLMTINLPSWSAYFWQVGVAAIFLPISILHYFAARYGGQRAKNGQLRGFTFVFVLLAVDVIVMGISFVTPNPFFAGHLPAASALASSPFFWFIFFLIHAAFSSNWRLVVWTGAWIFVVRVVQISWVASLPETITDLEQPILTIADRIEAKANLNFLFLFDRIGDLVGIASFTTATAFLVWRSHRVLERQVVAERARARISRYVSTAVVDEVMARGERFITPRETPVGVLFVDVVGFTSMAEQFTPEQSVMFLRQLHSRLAQSVFNHNGAIDKFLGDGLMATFGATRPSESTTSNAATDALACGIDMIDTIEKWNVERVAQGQPSIEIGVGLDFGPAFVGDIGDDRRLEFTVVGDTVNVAARVEALTRTSEGLMLVTERALEAARQSRRGKILAEQFVPAGNQSIKGRKETVRLCQLLPDAPAPSSEDTPHDVTPE